MAPCGGGCGTSAIASVTNILISVQHSQRAEPFTVAWAPEIFSLSLYFTQFYFLPNPYAGQQRFRRSQSKPDYTGSCRTDDKVEG